MKLSVIHPLELSSGDTTAPYLEYRIEIGNGDTIPLRFARVQGSGKSYGFKKDIQANIPQQTVIEALDFTIFQ
ncbi:MAG: hypothetical protein H6767_05515 [Candidatus Peribacteria bacterium]|nr:MAG: hypothetical protein H6767_05515 [Candidatus Peribacteria bacterium]